MISYRTRDPVPTSPIDIAAARSDKAAPGEASVLTQFVPAATAWPNTPVLLTAANEIRALYKRATGRGPEQARVWLAGPDAVLVLLAGTLSVAEQSLIRIGREDSVLTSRWALYRAMEDEIRALLARLVGRRILGFAPGVDLVHDVVSIVVTIAPAPVGESSAVATLDPHLKPHSSLSIQRGV
jgi:uncharacterized protein YbcI